MAEPIKSGLQEWFKIGEGVERFQVSGGWLYRTIVSAPLQAAPSVAMVFVPDNK